MSRFTHDTTSAAGASPEQRELHIHILMTPRIERPWWPMHQRLEGMTGKIWTDCCCCKMPIEEIDCRVVESYELPHGGLGCYQHDADPEYQSDRCDFVPVMPTGAYYEPRWEVRCADGFGCTVNRRKKSGRALREMWRFG